MRWGRGLGIWRRLTGAVEALLHLAFGIKTDIQRGMYSERNHGSLALKRGVKSSTGRRGAEQSVGIDGQRRNQSMNRLDFPSRREKRGGRRDRHPPNSFQEKIQLGCCRININNKRKLLFLFCQRQQMEREDRDQLAVP